MSYKFDTNVPRLCEILKTSVYSTHAVFLRELLSNASDALDECLQRNDTEGIDSQARNLHIELVIDRDNQTLTIYDNGIGMTNETMRQVLGGLQPKPRASVIGRFGLGFLSTYSVAHRIEVCSTHRYSGTTGNMWSTDSDTNWYSVRLLTPENKCAVRYGTSVKLYLKEETLHFLDLKNIARITQKYAGFLKFPIYLQLSAEPNLRWFHVNHRKPIWRYSPILVVNQLYINLYEQLLQEPNDTNPLAVIHVHCNAIQSILFVPSKPEVKSTIYLYVHQIYVGHDCCVDLLPAYLCFVRGVLEINDIQLNLSRDQPVWGVSEKSGIRQVLVNKLINVLTHMATYGTDDAYMAFYSEYHLYIKQGIVDDLVNRNQLIHLLRFRSDQSGGKHISLAKYVEQCDKQCHIYFTTNQNRPNSPLTETLTERGIEVLFMNYEIDLEIVKNVPIYRGLKFLCVNSTDRLQLAFTTVQKRYFNRAKKDFDPLCRKAQELLLKYGNNKISVHVSVRSISAPCILLERPHLPEHCALHLNTKHPLIIQANQLFQSNRNDKQLTGLFQTLMETCRVSNGLPLLQPTEYTDRIHRLLTWGLQVCVEEDENVTTDGYMEQPD